MYIWPYLSLSIYIYKYTYFPCPKRAVCAPPENLYGTPKIALWIKSMIFQTCSNPFFCRSGFVFSVIHEETERVHLKLEPAPDNFQASVFHSPSPAMIARCTPEMLMGKNEGCLGFRRGDFLNFLSRTRFDAGTTLHNSRIGSACSFNIFTNSL